jgi:Asp-tRNA(Asn)/Glu-tRNA(Gln) amidotransferase A subunit family amidase
MTDIFLLTTNELVEKLRDGHISSVEVCTQYIERIKKFEKDVNAWVHFNKKELLEKALEADV